MESWTLLNKRNWAATKIGTIRHNYSLASGILGNILKACSPRCAVKNNYHGEGYCVCCLNYKRKEVEGRELKLHRLTADKKMRNFRWSPLSETGKKSDSMFAPTIRTALFYIILFTLLRTEFFQYPDAFKNWDGVVYLKRSHTNKNKPMCYHYCFYATDRQPNPSANSISSVPLIYFCNF